MVSGRSHSAHFHQTTEIVDVDELDGCKLPVLVKWRTEGLALTAQFHRVDCSEDERHRLLCNEPFILHNWQTREELNDTQQLTIDHLSHHFDGAARIVPVFVDIVGVLCSKFKRNNRDKEKKNRTEIRLMVIRGWWLYVGLEDIRSEKHFGEALSQW